MYADAQARDADIERDAPRPSPSSSPTSARARPASRRPAAAPRTGRARSSCATASVDSAARVPFRRWVEVELHAVDLGVGYELEDLPAEFTERETDVPRRAVHRTPRRAADATRRTARARGTRAVRPTSPEATVTGAPADLLGWLAGRRDGPALTTDGGPLPALPPL